MNGARNVNGNKYTVIAKGSRLFGGSPIGSNTFHYRIPNGKCVGIDPVVLTKSEHLQNICGYIVTHAHEDHMGKIDAFVRMYISQGREIPPIFATAATKLHMLDLLKGSASRETLKILADKIKVVEYGKRIQITDGIEFIFRDAGHMSGAASIELFLKGPNGRTVKVVHTGDFTMKDTAFAKGFDPKAFFTSNVPGSPAPDRPDLLTMEASNAGRKTKKVVVKKSDLPEEIRRNLRLLGKFFVDPKLEDLIGKTEIDTIDKLKKIAAKEISGNYLGEGHQEGSGKLRQRFVEIWQNSQIDLQEGLRRLLESHASEPVFVASKLIGRPLIDLVFEILRQGNCSRRKIYCDESSLGQFMNALDHSRNNSLAAYFKTCLVPLAELDTTKTPTPLIIIDKHSPDPRKDFISRINAIIANYNFQRASIVVVDRDNFELQIRRAQAGGKLQSSVTPITFWAGRFGHASEEEMLEAIEKINPKKVFFVHSFGKKVKPWMSNLRTLFPHINFRILWVNKLQEITVA
jgi:glyoxylase-like metal-dependent hydrolase (beta-lactamase superfamily II)